MQPERPQRVAKDGEYPDGALARIVKYVPAEILTPYTLLFTALVSINLPVDQARYTTVFLMVLFLAATVGYVAKETTGKVRVAHLMVSPLAFLAWAYPISSALLGFWFVPLLAFLAQAVVIAVSIFVAPRERT